MATQMPAEGVMVLDPADDRVQKIGRAIGSPLAGDIIQAVSQKPRTLSAISESLKIPLNTAKYHVENLVDADLVEVVETRYSVKGRVVKIYGLKNQIVIVAPKSVDLRAFARKYSALFLVTLAGTVAIMAWQSSIFSPTPSGLLSTPMEMGIPPAPQSSPLLSAFPGLALAFLAGGILIILSMLVWELYSMRREIS